MQCPRCQQENRSSAKFCDECGTPLLRSSESAEVAPSYSDVQRALTEALEQQTGTSDILRVISGTPTDVQPVFDAIVQSAARLLDGHSANVLRVAANELPI